MSRTILDYFSTTSNTNSLAHEPLPYGTYYPNVSHSFLNAFINHVDVIKIYQLDRYENEDWRPLGVLYKEIGERNWRPFTKTKADLKELVVNQQIEFANTNLAMFGDDIVILAKVPNSENGFIFFWFDCDVSDCSIGKFRTDDSVKNIIKACENFLVRSEFPFASLPLSFLKGSISF